MKSTAKKQPTAQQAIIIKSKEDSDSILKVEDTLTEELVVALCGPIGSPLHKVSDELKNILEDKYGYECKIIKLSKIIEDNLDKVDQSPKSYSGYDRIAFLIDMGNKLREKYGESILTDLAITQIAREREEAKDKNPSKRFVSRRVCHVIDSLKNQQELEALKSVYREMLYVLGVFSTLDVREKKLTDQGMTLAQVYTLIDRDSGEEIKHGQTVRETFPNSDFFLRLDSGSDKQLTLKLDRLLGMIFGVEIATPSPHETAMYLASSAAGNSACLSRQVGAAIIDVNEELISVGWNDVPKAGGNLYQYLPIKDSTGEHDKRCMNIDGGKCHNDSEKKIIAEALAKDLLQAKVIDDKDFDKTVEIILKSKIKNLIEFSRSIHAEMHAIIMGSQTAGHRIRGGKLFCTVYPCHSCARHIVAAGIKEVYYIEPYRKSLAIHLHQDAVTEQETDKTKVRILAYEGVAPARYLKIFKAMPDSRKDRNGMRKRINFKTANPLYEVTLESLPVLEALVVHKLSEKNLINTWKEE